jgi:hypothetical protein
MASLPWATAIHLPCLHSVECDESQCRMGGLAPFAKRFHIGG